MKSFDTTTRRKKKGQGARKERQIWEIFVETHSATRSTNAKTQVKS